MFAQGSARIFDIPSFEGFNNKTVLDAGWTTAIGRIEATAAEQMHTVDDSPVKLEQRRVAGHFHDAIMKNNVQRKVHASSLRRGVLQTLQPLLQFVGLLGGDARRQLTSGHFI